MKKRIALLLIAALVVSLFAGCCLKHEWVEADCENPKTCAKCEKTEGEPLGHEWEDATCTEAKTCSECGETEGQALGHKWNDPTCTEAQVCSVCSTVGAEALGHDMDHIYFASEGDTVYMFDTCAVCGTEEKYAPESWETLADELILGKWFGVKSGGLYDDIWLDFTADGTMEFKVKDNTNWLSWYSYYSRYGEYLGNAMALDDGAAGLLYGIENYNGDLYLFSDTDGEMFIVLAPANSASVQFRR